MSARPELSAELSPELVERFKSMRADFVRLMLSYKFGMQEVETKVEILREEFAQLHSYNPIDHISTRLKSPQSVLDKVARKGFEPTLEVVRSQITDIAGVRVTCSFISDTYRVFDALTAQRDVVVLGVKDYIADPKPNGYRSLHAIIEIPVFLSSGPVHVPVEVQLRTVAMDFWASLEHKIFYKFDGDVPPGIVRRLSEAAANAASMDQEMEELHDTIHGPRHETPDVHSVDASVSDEVVGRLLSQLGASPLTP